MRHDVLWRRRGRSFAKAAVYSPLAYCTRSLDEDDDAEDVTGAEIRDTDAKLMLVMDELDAIPKSCRTDINGTSSIIRLPPSPRSIDGTSS